MGISGETSRDFIYDESGKLIFEDRDIPAGTPVSETTYAYNGYGERVKKVVDGVTTLYHYDQWGHLIAESDGTGQITRLYIYLGDQPLACVIKGSGGGDIYYYLNNHLGAPLKMIDSNNQVVWEARYSPFGKAETFGTIENNLRLPGQYFDAETGLCYNYHRYYDPRTGRYLTADPIGLDGGMNLYAYVLNDPVNFIDPEGLYDIPAFVTQATTSADLFITIWTAPGSGPKAVAAAVSIVADSNTFNTAEQGNGLAKSINYAGSIVGTGAAVAGGSAASVYLSSFGLGYTIGTDIAKISVYGTNQTIGGWWGNYLWDKFGKKTNCK